MTPVYLPLWTDFVTSYVEFKQNFDFATASDLWMFESILIPFSGKLTHHKICCYYRKGMKLCEIKTFLYKTVCRTHVKGNKLDLQKIPFFFIKINFSWSGGKNAFWHQNILFAKNFPKNSNLDNSGTSFSF